MNNYDIDIQTDLISLDFAKPFDSIPHQRLMYINSIGMVCMVHKWISEFLANRLQKVVLNSSYLFYFCENFLWCSRGTVLGPTLFLVYINYLPECVNHSKIRLFADNCIAVSVYRCIHNQQDAKLLQEDINAIQTWTSIWQMNFNISKCCLIHFT